MPAVKPAAKKPVVTRGNAPGSSNPNTVLVVLLVLFVLLSIGLGVWGYYAQAGQEDLKKKATDKEKETRAAQKQAEIYALGLREARLALGQNLDQDEMDKWEIARQDMLKDGGKFEGDPLRPIVLGLIQDMSKDLSVKGQPGFDDTTKKYSPTYKEMLAKMADDVKLARGNVTAGVKSERGAIDLLGKYNESLNNMKADALKKIDEGAKAALKASQAKYAEMDEQIRQNAQLRDKNSELEKEIAITKEDLNRKITALEDKLANAKTVKEAPVAAANPKMEGGPAGDMHGLIMDISKGKALWDRPVGRILRVIDGNQVQINLGSEDNIKPQLTFNVFLAHPDGRPDREMKGTIEVVRAIDGKTALANITSQTNKDFPIKADDGLFNPFFGAHVAIAGQINWFAAGGARGESPDEQVRSLNQFMRILKDQGVIVDAYVDLASGTIKGSINSRTRYLIRGDNLFIRAPAKEEMDKKGDPAMDKEDPAKDKEKEKEKDADKDAVKDKDKEKDPEKKDNEADPKPMPGGGDDAFKAMNEKRIQLANESIRTMQGQAIEKGCFIISAANFAVVTGYRRLITTINPAEAAFRPTLPAANVAPAGAGPARPPAAPKKDPDDKVP